MNDRQIEILMDAGVDLAGVMRRMADSEATLNSCLKSFLQDPNMDEMKQAIHNQAWKEAFAAAHTLKGIFGNMGFISLSKSASAVVELLRAGNTADLQEPLRQVQLGYDAMTDAIHRYFEAV
jgi:HPt (histidine-containing phosphotransfer) domain-containing protein